MRISDWSPDVCSSDLQALASAYLGPKPTGESPGIRIDAIGRSGIRRMEDMAGPLTTQPLPAIHDCDVHVHEREADLNAAGATNHLDGAREVLQCRSEEHTSELQSLMRISYAVFCLKKKNTKIRMESILM